MQNDHWTDLAKFHSYFEMYEGHISKLDEFKVKYVELRKFDCENHDWRWLVMYCCYLERLKEEARIRLNTEHNIVLALEEEEGENSLM